MSCTGHGINHLRIAPQGAQVEILRLPHTHAHTHTIREPEPDALPAPTKLGGVGAGGEHSKCTASAEHLQCECPAGHTRNPERQISLHAQQAHACLHRFHIVFGGGLLRLPEQLLSPLPSPPRFVSTCPADCHLTSRAVLPALRRLLARLQLPPPPRCSLSPCSTIIPMDLVADEVCMNSA